MATRDLTDTMLAAIQAGNVKPALFYEGEYMVSGVLDYLRLWTGVGSITWDGKTWLGGGQLLGISVLGESAAIRAQGFSVTLSGMPSAVVSLALVSGPVSRNKAGRLWLALFAPVAYADLPGSSGNYLSTPDSAALQITADLDVRVKCSLDDWTPAATSIVIGQYLNTGTQRSWVFQVLTNGRLDCNFSLDGSGTLSGGDSGVATGFVDGSTHWLRFTRVASTGVLKYYTSEDGITWTQLGTDKTSTAGTLHNSTGVLGISGHTNGTTQPWAGNVYMAEVYTTIDGASPVSRFDAHRFTAGATTATMTTGEVWTRNGGATAPPIVHLADEILADPYLLKRGRFDVIPIQDNGATATIEARYEDRLFSMNTPRESHYTSESQALRAADDQGFNYVEQLQDAVFKLA